MVLGRKQVKLAGILFLLIFLLFSLVLSLFWFVPLSRHTHSMSLMIEPGASAKRVIADLTNKQVLTPNQALILRLFLKLSRQDRNIHAGEYHIAMNITPQKLMKKIISGDVVLHAVRFKEGGTLKEILTDLWQHSAIKSVSANRDLSEIQLQVCQDCRSLEGALFPDTYYFHAQTTDLMLLKTAYQNMQVQLESIWAKRAPWVVLQSPYEALILASIIEKEASVPAELAKISGVLQQRLQKNMRLQVDPTVLYACGKPYGEKLTLTDLKYDSPYNTYLHKGLPPTPIALPSLPALIAACQPEQHDYLYFVAKGDGTHYFSKTLKEHNKAVAQYQKVSNQK